MSASSPVTTTSISTSSAAAARGRATSFIPELQSMMFSLGDVRRPLQESAALVEDIVHTQLLNILQQAGEVALTRGARVISPEDIVFLMRRDKKKLQRLVKYLHFRDYKSRILKSVEDEEPLDSERVVSGQHRRQRLLQDFLSSIDQTGEFQTLVEEPEVDEVKQERLERMERMTRNMDAAQYSDFCESRQLSFSKKASKFRDWLDCSALEVKPSVVSMEVLSYLAYETVAQLVDLALLVKQDMSARAGDVFRQAASATFIQYSEAAGVKREAESPENTPPSTPQLKNGGVAQDGAKAKQRKRKKSAAAASGAEPVSGAITPSHIREAVRRYSSREPLSSFSSVFRRTGMTFLTC